MALTFATLAGIALATAEDRATQGERLDHLQDALVTRAMIGQAQGILMERGRITAEAAFVALSRASQHSNRKLRDIAQLVVDTGELPAGVGSGLPHPTAS